MSDRFSFFHKKDTKAAHAEEKKVTSGNKSPQKDSGSAGEKKPAGMVYASLPTIKGAAVQKGDLFFTCPACGEVNRLPADAVHPVLGERSLCSSCGTLIHISGFDPFSMRASEIIINSGVPVRLIEFDTWYQNHPVTLALRKRNKQETHIEYGLWVYCIRCHHSFSAALLMNIPPVLDPRMMLRMGMDKANIREMMAIKSGRCPTCGNTVVMVIITDIPERVVHMIEDQEYGWDQD
jgi:hypothetical protein